MFEFKKLKEDIHDWANDVQGNSERTLEIIKEMLVPINNITKFWKEDKAYIESQKEITLFGSNFYAFGNASAFLANLKLSKIKKEIKECIINGLDYEEAKNQTLKHYADLYKLEISNEEQFEKFCSLFDEFEKLIRRNRFIKINIIINNYINIFSYSLITNIIRKKNGYYQKVIGSYDNVEIILGEKGEKLRNGETQALIYIIKFESLEEKLNAMKTNIEILQSSKKLR